LYKVILLPEAEKFYKKLYTSDKSHFRRIAQALESLRRDPFQGKSLKHKLKGKYSLRVGSYRVIYVVEKRKITVYIFDIGLRRDVYQI
jgi:mRNA interferase RelE/StbE